MLEGILQRFRLRLPIVVSAATAKDSMHCCPDVVKRPVGVLSLCIEETFRGLVGVDGDAEVDVILDAFIEVIAFVLLL